MQVLKSLFGGSGGRNAQNHTILPAINPVRKIVWKKVNYTSKEYNVEECEAEESEAEQRKA